MRDHISEYASFIPLIDSWSSREGPWSLKSVNFQESWWLLAGQWGPQWGRECFKPGGHASCDGSCGSAPDLMAGTWDHIPWGGGVLKKWSLPSLPWEEPEGFTLADEAATGSFCFCGLLKMGNRGSCYTWLRNILKFVVIESPSCIWLFETPWTAAHQASLSLTVSQSLPKFMSIESVMCHPTISSSVTLFSFFLQSFPPSGSFPVSRLSASGGQSIGASASVLPMSVQGWFPLGLPGWISLLSKGLSGVFSSTAVRKHQFFGTQLSLRSNSHNWILKFSRY